MTYSFFIMDLNNVNIKFFEFQLDSVIYLSSLFQVFKFPSVEFYRKEAKRKNIIIDEARGCFK